MGTEPAERHTNDPVVTQLISLSRNAHVNVDLDDPADYWYRLGQRNAYAYAVGLVLTRGVTERAFDVSDRITTDLSDGRTDVAAIEQSVAAKTDSTARTQLEWVGPQSFARREGGVPGIDRDFGMRWGERGDVRISLRRVPEATAGMLYAYDPLWDEYAVLGRDVPTVAVEAAFTQALQMDVHMDVVAFNELVQSHVLRGTALTCRPQSPAGRVLEP